jgi:hypothetical protein
MTQGVDRGMDLGAFAPYVAVIPAATTALRRRRQRPTVENCCRGLPRTSRCQAQEQPQVVDHRLVDPDSQPVAGLLVDLFVSAGSPAVAAAIPHGCGPATGAR